MYSVVSVERNQREQERGKTWKPGTGTRTFKVDKGLEEILAENFLGLQMNKTQ